MKEKQPENQTINQSDDSDTSKRRENLRKILVGGGVISSAGMIPEKWSSAVVQSVVLPAHAQSSGLAAGNFNGQGQIP